MSLFFSLYLLLPPPKSRIPVVVSNTTIVYTTRRLSVGSALSSWMSLRGADNSGGPFVPPSLFCSTANPELLATAYCLHHTARNEMSRGLKKKKKTLFFTWMCETYNFLSLSIMRSASGRLSSILKSSAPSCTLCCCILSLGQVGARWPVGTAYGRVSQRRGPVHATSFLLGDPYLCNPMLRVKALAEWLSLTGLTAGILLVGQMPAAND